MSRAPLDLEKLIASIETVCGIYHADFRGESKSLRAVRAKELTILTERRLGGTVTMLADLVVLSVANRQSPPRKLPS